MTEKPFDTVDNEILEEVWNKVGMDDTEPTGEERAIIWNFGKEVITLIHQRLGAIVKKDWIPRAEVEKVLNDFDFVEVKFIPENRRTNAQELKKRLFG